MIFKNCQEFSPRLHDDSRPTSVTGLEGITFCRRVTRGRGITARDCQAGHWSDGGA